MKAKCPENQAALDRLNEKRTSLLTSLNHRRNDRYATTLKRAMQSLADATMPIRTYNEALTLPHVGQHCASLIHPPTAKAAAAKPAAKRKRIPETKKNATTPLSEKNPNRCQDSSSVLKRNNSTSSSTNAFLPPPSHTSKELAYQTAVHDAINWKEKILSQQQPGDDPLQYRVMLLIDQREVHSEHILAKCSMSGIPCEERTLPIGDMAWIVQGIRRKRRSSSDPDPQRVVVEFLLGTILERKTTEDLKSSLFGTRYFEQRLRLQYSGLPQVLFLIEGDIEKDLCHCPADTLHSAVWETRLHLGFRIVHTEHVDETVRLLKRIHRRILQRTFPTAFAKNEALPEFQEVFTSSSSNRRRQTINDQDRRRRRRRLQSLNELLFDSEPQVPLGMERFISYQELKAKIERDRELGTKTIGNIHLAMIKQVSSVSDTKCHAIARLYPTMHSLMEAYHTQNLTESEQQNLMAEIPTHDDQAPKKKSARNNKIGPKSSAELFNAFCIDNDDDNDIQDLTTWTHAPERTIPFLAAALPPIAEQRDGKPSSLVHHELWQDECFRPSAALHDSESGKRRNRIVHSTQDVSLSSSSSSEEDSPQKASAIVPHNRSTSFDQLNHNNHYTMAMEKPTKVASRKCLNTSIGSLLDDSTTDEESLMSSVDPSKQKRTSSSRVLPSNSDSGHSIKTTTNGKHENDLSSSEDNDVGWRGSSLRERLQSRIASEKSTMNQSLRRTDTREVIEID
jgi:ERCC4-type nuclease